MMAQHWLQATLACLLRPPDPLRSLVCCCHRCQCQSPSSCSAYHAPWGIVDVLGHLSQGLKMSVKPCLGRRCGAVTHLFEASRLGCYSTAMAEQQSFGHRACPAVCLAYLCSPLYSGGVHMQGYRVMSHSCTGSTWAEIHTSMIGRDSHCVVLAVQHACVRVACCRWLLLHGFARALLVRHLQWS